MKKTTKTASRTSVAAKSKTSKKAAPPARRSVGVAAKAPAAAGPPPKVEPDSLKEFEAAMKLFRAGSFKDAKRSFDQLTDAPAREVAHAARLHSRMCEQRLAKAAPALNTAEDFYNYGVALVNQRNLETAQTQLETALKMAPQADHILYAMALCLGLRGDLAGAHQHLKRAIELQPRNRALARNDPDFAEIVRKSPIIELISHQPR